MATFEYTGRDKNSEMREGLIEASSQEGAVDTLQQTGLVIVSIRERSKPFFSRIRIGGRVKQKDLVIFSRQLSTLFEAEIPVVQALKTLVSETEKKALQQIVSDVLDDITGGLALSQALAKHPLVFSMFYVNLVRSGEESGKLKEIFTYLADYLERSYYLSTKARNAMIYPAFILFTFLIVLVLMMTIVIPRLSTIFDEAGQQLPVYTRAILGLSLFMRQWGLLVLFFAIVAGGYLWWWIKTEEGKGFFHRLQIHLPLFGGVYQKLYMARMADSLKTLIAGGTPILRALSITGDVINNVVYKKATEDAVTAVREGNTISSAFEKTPEIPKLVTGMMRIGEESGRLDYILGSLAKFYQREVDAAIDNLLVLIEPILILFLGGGVAILVAAIMVPIYGMVGNF